MVHLGDNILTALSVGRECELVKPDQTVIRVEAELQTDQYSPHLNVSYTLEENEKTNIRHDVSNNATGIECSFQFYKSVVTYFSVIFHSPTL